MTSINITQLFNYLLNLRLAEVGRAGNPLQRKLNKIIFINSNNNKIIIKLTDELLMIDLISF